MTGTHRLVTGVVVGLLVVAAVRPTSAQHGEAPYGFVLGGSVVPAIGNWVVLTATGAAWWRLQGEAEWRRFETGEVLVAGSEIATGGDGEVALVGGGDRLIVRAAGRLVLPPAEVGQDRRLRQQRGHIRVEVEDLGERDFRVDTPLLSLGIKGTTFEVFVDREENSVAVLEGVVAVTTRDAPEPVDVAAGHGLRQSAVSGVGAVRLEFPAVAVAGHASDAPAWLLPEVATDVVQSGDLPAASDDRRSVDQRQRAERTQANGAPRPDEQATVSESAPRDPWPSSWIFFAVAVATITVLTIPGVALLQNLRQQWLDRPVSRGKRRRELTRGW